MIYNTKRIKRGRGSQRFSKSLLYSALAVVLVSGTSVAPAADRYWDVNGTAVGSGGTGTWDLSNLYWSPSSDGVSGPFQSAWSNSALDNAIFAGTAGTVTLGDSITAHNLTFSTDGYTLTGGTLTLAGTSPTISVPSGTTIISSTVAGTSGLVKSGSGQLELTGTNTFSGDITILSATLYATTDAALGAASNNIIIPAGDSGNLKIGGTTGTTRSVTVENGATLNLVGSGSGSALISGSGSVNVHHSNSGAGAVTLSNDNNTYTGTTTFNGCDGHCVAYFTSIADLGVASSLGAPTTAANGTVTFYQTSQYQDDVDYIGSGSSSNRDWDIEGNDAFIKNEGTGALTISGDVYVSVGSTFVADTADLNLLGVLSGGDYNFDAASGQSITLGGENTFTDTPTITGVVNAPVLADGGSASSLGTSSEVDLDAGTLSYTGTGDSSNRTWVVTGDSGLLNNGSGALTLSGDMTLGDTDKVADSLTLGGSFTGVNSISGVLSGTADLISDGSGTWRLDGANTFTGAVTINSGVLQAGSSSAFESVSGFTIDGGTLDLNDFDLTAASISGTGGTIDLGSATLTDTSSSAESYAGSIVGTGGFTKSGAGTLTLTAASTYTGATTIKGGELALDFGGSNSPSDNILSASSALVLSGGTLSVTGANGGTNSQTFDGLAVAAGSNTLKATSGTGGTVDVAIGTLTRTGGIIDFELPTTGAISTTNADGKLGGWATVNGTDYAKVVDGDIVAFDETDYTDKDDASTWLSGEIISDAGGEADTPFYSTVSSNVFLEGLRYTAAADSTVTIADGDTLGVDGTILVSSSVGSADQTITGGSLTSGATGGTLGLSQNGSGTFTIASTIVDGSGVTSFAKSGSGTAQLSGANTYTGSTTISDGTLQVSSIGNGGIASNIGASSADASNLVLEGGTLQYTGDSATTDRGFTLVDGGTSRTIDVSNSATDLTFTGLVTSSDDAGFTKAGAGTLTLANSANDYVGVTTVSGGTLAITTLTDGGQDSSIGAASSDSANIVLAGGTLSYTGATTESDRGMTLGTGGGGIGVSDADSTLTLSGVLTGTSLTKVGAGTLVLSGENTYTDGTTVSAGTLRAGAENVFGGGAMSVTAGALLDLDNYDNSVSTLTGAGDVDLGAATLTVTTGGNFTGTISGTGGLTRTGSSQYALTLSGCNNTYTGATTIGDGSSISVSCLANGGVASDIGASSNASSNLSIGSSATLIYTGDSVTTDRGFTLASKIGVIQVASASTTLEFSGAVTGTGGLRKTGPGTLVLSGVNSSTGANQIYAGTLRAGSTTAFGTGSMTLSNTAGVLLDLDDYNNSVAYLAGGGTTGGTVDLDGATLTITAGSTSFTAANYAGMITGSGGLTKNGSQIQQLSGCNSDYNGVTTINNGTLAVACLDNGGSDSSIGASSAAASNLVLNGGTLEYVGTGDSTDRQFTLGASSTSELDASGSGAINFTNAAAISYTAANTAQTLTLGGTSTANNTLAAQITNNGTGATKLTKSGAGTWILTNQASTYTGVTTINGGVLGVDKLSDGGVASSIGASSSAASNLVIGNGSTLRYTGDGDSTNRLFTLAAGVTYLESSGTGAVVFDNTGAVTFQGSNQARTIALGGTNTDMNTLAGSVGDAGTGVTTLAKNDVGTWALTGTNTYTGSTNINAGILYIGNGGTTGSIVSSTVNDYGTLGFNRSDTVTYAGTIVGTGSLLQAGTGTTILTGTETYSGGTTIEAGTLQLGNGGTTGSIVGNVVDDGALDFNRSDTSTFGGVISGNGAVVQDGSGTTVLSATNSYSGGTTINAGTLQISADANLGDAAGELTFNGGTLHTTANILSARKVALAGTDTVLTDADTSLELDGTVSGTGALTKSGDGTLLLTADDTYSGGTTIADGTLQLGDGGTTGSILGDVVDDGTLIFNRSDDVSFAGLVSGSGGVVQDGTGVVTLTADNSYSGSTVLNAGTLLVDGDQSAATGLTTVNSGATLGGSGVIGGDVVVKDGGTLSPGGTTDSVGTLAINGGLSLSSGSTLNYDLGEANTVGGALNDLVKVGGNLVLDGTVNVTTSTGGSFGGGIYRLFNYAGTLTDNGLDIGTMPAGASVTVQTSVTGEVNLVNSAGLDLSFWDGDAGPKFNDQVDGGVGVWQLAGSSQNWTDEGGTINASYADGTFAIFEGSGDTVTVDNSNGAVTASGMQFASDGYLITGDALTLTGTQAVIRVGDGTTEGAAYTATIASELTGNSVQLDKTDYGTLVLTGKNSYSGGTLISGGTLQLGNGGTTGSILGDVVDNGTLAFDRSDDTSFDGTISGTGALVKNSDGVLTLTGINSYTGGTTLNAGTLQISADANLGDVSGKLTFDGGVLNTTADIDSTRGVTLAGTGTVLTDANTTLQLDGAISGKGELIKSGAGTLLLTAADAYSGGTTIADGTLQLGNGGTSGSILGDVVDNGTLVFDRADDLTFAGLVSGSGDVIQSGSGVVTLTADNSYSGTTVVDDGTLLVNGDQSAATGTTTVNSGATLGGAGVIGGDVVLNDGATISPGSAADTVGTLTINGDLSLAKGASLNYDFGQANVAGGSLNDLINVSGNLTLDGTLNVTTSTGGGFDPGIYRVINYSGTLSDDGLSLGTVPSDADLYVQTSVAQEVNLVSTDGLALRFWDGGTGARNDGVITGGDGLWQNTQGNDNWTLADGSINAPFLDSAFAVFEGTGGTVTVDDSLGSINVTGMQFATDGYVVQGDPLNLVGSQAIIRVGDGTAEGAADTATIASDLTGDGVQLDKTDLGTLVLTGENSYSGGTLISAGTLQLGDGGTTGSILGDVADNGVLAFDRADDTSFDGTISGTGAMVQKGEDVLTLTADNTYSGGTTIASGTLRLGDGGTTGSILGDVVNDGTLSFDRSDDVSFTGLVSGSGGIVQDGSGVVTLTAANSYSGSTVLNAGTLLVDGDQSAASGLTTVNSGATLGGSGVVGGDVVVEDGGTLSPGGSTTSVGTLAINGNLSLSSGSTLNYDLGEANTVAGSLNDLVTVGGNLVLGGTINVSTSTGGDFGGGIYRVFNYDGTLTDNGLQIGTLPAGASVTVQTSVAGEVNLVNTTGLDLSFWDGGAGPKADGVVDGGSGVWQLAGSSKNWTDEAGTVNAAYSDGTFAIFAGSAGTVTVDNGNGAVTASGMQFADDGYLITGDALTLTGTQAVIRVGDGTTEGAGYTATIASALTGDGVQLDKTDLGTLVLMGENSYSGGTLISGGTLQLGNGGTTGSILGDVIDNGTLAFNRSDDTTFAGTISGTGAVVKDGDGVLTLAGTNSYAGGTILNAGTLQISADANLGDASGQLTFDGGALATTSDITSGRGIDLQGGGTISTAADTAFTLNGVLSGDGTLTKSGTGTLTVTGDSDGFTGVTSLAAGTLNVLGSLGGEVDVQSEGLLQGTGEIGSITNSGTVAPGVGGIGTLTVAGDYVGNGGTLAIETVLGGDNSSTDQLVVKGSTSGDTLVTVTNLGGLGAQTIDGIKIIDVTGASDGTFTLKGDYLFNGQQAVIAGAYGYRLYQNGVTDTTDGDWYLRSSLLDSGDSTKPLYQPGVPVYESYAQTLLELDRLPTLQQRIGNRMWGARLTGGDGGFWSRVDSRSFHPQAASSTSSTDSKIDSWKIEAGVDMVLSKNEDGSALVSGFSVHHGKADSSVTSVFGNGSINVTSGGVGATLTWYGAKGLYVDAQAQYSEFVSDLKSSVLGSLANNNNGQGEAASVELGQRFAVSNALALTPQFQAIYSHVNFDSFTDPSAATISSDKGSSLKTRFGLALDQHNSWSSTSGDTRHTHVYGIANLTYEWLGATGVDVSGTSIDRRDHRAWGELGMGGSYNWGGGAYTIYAEISADTALANFGDAYSFKASAGFRASF